MKSTLESYDRLPDDGDENDLFQDREEDKRETAETFDEKANQIPLQEKEPFIDFSDKLIPNEDITLLNGDLIIQVCII